MGVRFKPFVPQFRRLVLAEEVAEQVVQFVGRAFDAERRVRHVGRQLGHQFAAEVADDRLQLP